MKKLLGVFMDKKELKEVEEVKAVKKEINEFTFVLSPCKTYIEVYEKLFDIEGSFYETLVTTYRKDYTTYCCQDRHGYNILLNSVFNEDKKAI